MKKITKIITIFTLLSLLIGCGGSEEGSSQTDGSSVKQKKQNVLSLQLYIENSGSMRGYDGPRNNGDFKSVITDLHGNFSQAASTPEINYVNSRIVPYNGNFTNLIKTSVFTGEDQIGSTDFSLIFNSILSTTSDNKISVLFSDLIYSDPNNATRSPQNLLSTVEGLTRDAFNRSARDISLIIVKLIGDFNGKYYPYNSPKNGKFFKGSRPYYMLICANNKTMKEFLTNKKYENVTNFSKYKGFEDLIYFSSNGLKDNPKYSFLDGDPKNKATFNTGGNQGDTIKFLTNVKPLNGGEKLTLSIGISLPESVFSSSEIDTSSFDIVSMVDKFKPIAIERIDRQDGLTHRLVIEAQRVAHGERTLEIKLKNKMPSWVSKTNSVNDIDTSGKFAIQTFGIGSLINGIQEAYGATNNTHTFTLRLTLNEND